MYEYIYRGIVYLAALINYKRNMVIIPLAVLRASISSLFKRFVMVAIPLQRNWNYWSCCNGHQHDWFENVHFYTSNHVTADPWQLAERRFCSVRIRKAKCERRSLKSKFMQSRLMYKPTNLQIPRYVFFKVDTSKISCVCFQTLSNLFILSE